MGPRSSTDSEYQSPTHSECQSPVSSEYPSPIRSKWQSVERTECDGCWEYTNPSGEYKIKAGEHAEEEQQQLGLWVRNPPADDSGVSVTDHKTLGGADSDCWSWQRTEWWNR